MQINFIKNNVKFLGKEEKTSQKGNKYSVITFLDGATTHTFLSKVVVPEYSFGQEISVQLVCDYNVKFPGVVVVGY